MQTNDVCIEDGGSVIGAEDRRCGRPIVTRAGDQVIVTIDCAADGQRETTSLLFTGDFQSWYRAQSRTTAEASRSGFTIEAKFFGDQCVPKRAR